MRIEICTNNSNQRKRKCFCSETKLILEILETSSTFSSEKSLSYDRNFTVSMCEYLELVD